MTTFGIDLGTTYSCVAYIDDTGRAVVAKNTLGDETTPSVVQFEEGNNVVVGMTAKEFARIEPDNVASLVKRKMGEDIEYDFHGEIYNPEKISALILKELAEGASATLSKPVEQVVITVPAYFGVLEKEATRRAGEIAGLEVLDLIPEPVAAALHYEAMAGETGKTILVYDLGGGTFDTTVIRVDSDQVRVVCTDGNHQLGGADWDERLSNYLIEQFENEHPDSDAATDERFLQDVSLAAETLKKQLSQAETRRQGVFHNGLSAQVEVTREKFEELTADLLEETMTITQRTIDEAARRGHASFDEVLLVGGSTAMPDVAKQLRSRFGFEPKIHDPHLAVAKGAALYAMIASVKIVDDDGNAEVSDEEVQRVAEQTGIAAATVRELSEKEIINVAPRAFGVKVLDSDQPGAKEIVAHIIFANDALPAKPKPFEAATVAHNQTGIEIRVWEQTGEVASEELAYNTEIGDGMISDIPPLPAGSPIEIDFAMDATGLLQVAARETTHGKACSFEIQIGGMSQEDVEQAKSDVAAITVSS